MDKDKNQIAPSRCKSKIIASSKLQLQFRYEQLKFVCIWFSIRVAVVGSPRAQILGGFTFYEVNKVNSAEFFRLQLSLNVE
uniref:Uncharacterized protein n=1 Tax=Romanomermis culicivorax TaxID=13658 RepID=A0A915K3C0_ROMCU